jgi:hypothetical protein
VSAGDAKLQRLSHWRRHEARAHKALSTGEWWNGSQWRPHSALPRSQKEAAAYRTAHDRLAEILDAMVGGDDETRLAKASRFGQSANALRKRDARKNESKDAWATLLAYASLLNVDLITTPLTKQLILGCVAELKRGRFRTRHGSAWDYEGVKSFLRRRRRL